MTRSSFGKLSIQSFFLLHKAYDIWPDTFLKEYLAQFEVDRGIRINDATWNEVFTDISDRFL